jgi:hypothetical protein
VSRTAHVLGIFGHRMKKCLVQAGLEKNARPLFFGDSFFLPHACIIASFFSSPILFSLSLRVLRYHLFCFASMDLSLDSSGLSSTTLLGATRVHLASNLVHTPNKSHGQFFNPNTSLLVDRMHNACMTPDSSPVVSAPMTICASKSSHPLPLLERVVFSSRASA